MLGTLVACLAATCCAGFQDPEPGVSRQLAQQRRAIVSNVSYELSFELAAGASTVTGHLVWKFDLPEDVRVEAPLIADFGGESLTRFEVNGQELAEEMRRVADHLVIPAAALVRGPNLIEAEFSSRIAATGTPLTRYEDPVDGAEYLYTLLVPADAHALFPCFDQPDLKARFELRLIVPAGWQAVANAESTNDPAVVEFPAVPRLRVDGRLEFSFAPTAALPTYLFAFAAGPFAVVEDDQASGVGTDPARRLKMYLRRSRLEHVDAPLLFRMHRDSLRWLADWFGTGYPFDKLDFVLLPGFPFGGMEHAGAIFYRESALCFEREPTSTEQLRRSTLIYHEVAHQWFGNLVTFEWFDDLWLKEGFATFLGYTLVEALEPGRNAWLRFHQRVKPRAYEIDATAGTTPIYQKLGNLADAKSAYGAIVYNKAPAVLRELEARLGKEDFRRGVRLFVREHAFGNATWRDLVDALSAAGGLRGTRWSDRWILGRGLPRVSVEWTSDEQGRIDSFELLQSAAGDEVSWPLALDILLLDRDGGVRRARSVADEPRTTVESLIGEPEPAAVLLNPSDVAYGLFVLDAKSCEYLLAHTAELEDSLLRAVAVSALQQTTKDAALDPRAFADLLLELIAGETDAGSHDWLLEMLGTVTERWISGEDAARVRARSEELLLGQLEAGAGDRSLETLRYLAVHGRGARSLALLRGVLDGDVELAGLELAPRDRFLFAAGLLAAGDAEAVRREVARAGEGSDVAKWAYVAGAAGPDEATKAQWFASYQQPDEPPEQWMQDSLGSFHWPGQEALTLPYLRPALDLVDQVKSQRRIFFMPAWIDAFVNGHSTPAALEIVVGFLAEREERGDLDADIRLKLLQSLDRLERALRIRATFD